MRSCAFVTLALNRPHILKPRIKSRTSTRQSQRNAKEMSSPSTNRRRKEENQQVSGLFHNHCPRRGRIPSKETALVWTSIIGLSSSLNHRSIVCLLFFLDGIGRLRTWNNRPSYSLKLFGHNWTTLWKRKANNSSCNHDFNCWIKSFVWIGVDMCGNPIPTLVLRNNYGQ